MIGEVIAINYQLYVRFTKDLIVILHKDSILNVIGSWCDFSLHSGVREDKDGRFTDYHYISGGGISFPKRHLAEEYSTFDDKDSKTRRIYKKTYALSYEVQRNWMRESGYSKGSYHDTLRERYLKVKKITNKIYVEKL